MAAIYAFRGCRRASAASRTRQENSKLLSEMVHNLTEYLFHAASFQTVEEIHLDPKILIPIAQANSHAFAILRTVAEDFGVVGLATFSEMVAEAADRWNALLEEAQRAKVSRQ
jgi:hypothetical protein